MVIIKTINLPNYIIYIYLLTYIKMTKNIPLSINSSVKATDVNLALLI